MKITFDPQKRDRALLERGIDFADAAEVFSGPTYRFSDVREDYGELRMILFGLLRGRMVVIVYGASDWVAHHLDEKGERS